jgi:hypothetical protein
MLTGIRFYLKDPIAIPDIMNLYKKPNRYNSLYKKYANHTMVPEKVFEENLKLIHQFAGVNGDFVECGTWKGGMTAAAADLLGDERGYLLFDSFEGLPPVEAIDGPAAKRWQNDTTSPWYYNNCTADVADADEAMKLSKCNNYKIVKGWFEQTLPSNAADIEIAILRLDADWYKSTYTCLEHLFPKVKENGLVIIDDYYFGRAVRRRCMIISRE